MRGRLLPHNFPPAHTLHLSNVTSPSVCFCACRFSIRPVREQQLTFQASRCVMVSSLDFFMELYIVTCCTKIAQSLSQSILFYPLHFVLLTTLNRSLRLPSAHHTLLNPSFNESSNLHIRRKYGTIILDADSCQIIRLKYLHLSLHTTVMKAYLA